MSRGTRYELAEWEGYSRSRLFQARDLQSIESYIREKHAPHREPATDGGHAWQDRIPESVKRGGDG